MFVHTNIVLTTINKSQMKKVFHPANSRGNANHGWLKANYSFSFANYFDPERIQFGALSVLIDFSIER